MKFNRVLPKILVATMMLSMSTSVFASTNTSSIDKNPQIDTNGIIDVIVDNEKLLDGDLVIDTNKSKLVGEISDIQSISTIGAENVAPIAGLQIFVLNPESMQNNQFTTETMFFLAWTWNGVDYTYDPDGDAFEMYLAGTTNAVTQRLTDSNGAYDGIAVQFINSGNYTIQFFAVDTNNNASNSIYQSFNIIESGSVDSLNDFENATTLNPFYNFKNDSYSPTNYVTKKTLPSTDGDAYEYTANDLKETTFLISSGDSSNIKIQVFDESLAKVASTDGSGGVSGENYSFFNGYSTKYISKVKFNTTPNNKYYVKVYDASGTNSTGEYYFAAGEPTLYVDTIKYEINNISNVVKGEEYTYNINFSEDINNDFVKYAHTLKIPTSSSFQHYFDYKVPNSYSWQYAGSYSKEFPKSFDQLQKLDGTWTVKLYGYNSGAPRATELSMLYWLEM